MANSARSPSWAAISARKTCTPPLSTSSTGALLKREDGSLPSNPGRSP